MDNRGQLEQIAELIDMLNKRGIKHVKLEGFAGLSSLEMQLGTKPSTSPVVTDFSKNSESYDADLQYAATGFVPIQLSEIRKE